MSDSKKLNQKTPSNSIMSDFSIFLCETVLSNTVSPGLRHTPLMSQNAVLPAFLQGPNTKTKPICCTGFNRFDHTGKRVLLTSTADNWGKKQLEISYPSSSSMRIRTIGRSANQIIVVGGTQRSCPPTRPVPSGTATARSATVPMPWKWENRSDQ